MPAMHVKFLIFSLLAIVPLIALRAEPENRVTYDVRSTAEHPRNDVGAFITLKSGRILSYYPQFYTGSSDYSSARLVEIHSDDQGRTWSQPKVFAEKGDNVNLMSVSFLRLASGRIAMFYVVKKSGMDCHPYLRISSDEGASWSEPRPVIEPPGYFVLNNDRVIQTSTGRLIVPVAFNRLLKATEDEPGGEHASTTDYRGIILWYLSDDEGATWREADSWWAMPVPSANGLQEPGVAELADGSLFSWARTDHGEQFEFRSHDGGKTWSPPQPTELKSPCSPASIKRLPHSGALLAIYNDYSGKFPFVKTESPYGGRTPLVAAISYDGGKTWPVKKLLEGDLNGAFAYPAIHFIGDAVLLSYNTGAADGPHLGGLRIRRVALSWLQPAP